MMKRIDKRRPCLPSIEIIKDEIITNEEIDEWKWKSYHKIDVKQNMGDGRHNDMYQNRNKTLRVCLVTLF